MIDLEHCNKAQWYRKVKRLGNADIREERELISLPEFESKTDKEIADSMATFLASISIECPLINSNTYREVYKKREPCFHYNKRSRKSY